jgi:hypothetical protein
VQNRNDLEAAFAVRSALVFRRWVNRRVETFQFLDADTVRRRMSVDFQLEAFAPLQGKSAYVPLMILAKRDLRNLDVVDEEGHPLSVLTTTANARVAARGLEMILRPLWPPALAFPRQEIREIVMGSPEAAAGVARRALALGGSIAGPLAQRVQEVPQQYQEELNDWIENVKALVQELAGGFLLLVPIELVPGKRRIIKFSYDAELRRFMGADEGRASAVANTIVSSFGWVARIESFHDLPVGWSASYHAEVVPPPDAFTAQVSLSVLPGKKGAPVEITRDRHRSRPHVRAASAGRGDKGRLSVQMHARRESLVVPLFLASALLTTILAFISARHASLEPQSLAALLVVPFALAAYYARSAENGYVTRALRWLRFVALIPVAAGISALALLALGSIGWDGHRPSDATLDWLREASHAAIAATMILAVSLLAPLFGRLIQPAVNGLSDYAERSEGWTGQTYWALFLIARAAGLIAVALGVLWTLYRLLPI